MGFFSLSFLCLLLQYCEVSVLLRSSIILRSKLSTRLINSLAAEGDFSHPLLCNFFLFKWQQKGLVLPSLLWAKKHCLVKSWNVLRIVIIVINIHRLRAEKEATDSFHLLRQFKQIFEKKPRSSSFSIRLLLSWRREDWQTSIRSEHFLRILGKTNKTKGEKRTDGHTLTCRYSCTSYHHVCTPVSVPSLLVCIWSRGWRMQNPHSVPFLSLLGGVSLSPVTMPRP